MLRRKVIILAPILAIICLTPGAFLRSKIEQAVAAKAPTLLGPARSYSVSANAGLFDILSGKVNELTIRGNDVKLKNGIVVDRLDIDLSGVRFNPDQTVTGVDSTAFTASLSQAHLQDYFRGTRSDMSDAEVSLTPGRLSVSAKPRVFAVKTPVQLDGGLQITQGTKLNIVLDRLSARGIRIPGFVRGRIQHDINPVLDTQQMGMGAKLTKVAITNGEITLSGTADVKQALAGK